ncbi:MAG: DUF3426 domain-containing protein, partial [Gemmatimonadota bacterium]
MALATRCPNCHALFRVVADQLKLRGGLVRCGACRHVFDAIGTLSYLDDASLRPVSPDGGSPLMPHTRSTVPDAEEASAAQKTDLAPAPSASGPAESPRPASETALEIQETPLSPESDSAQPGESAAAPAPVEAAASAGAGDLDGRAAEDTADLTGEPTIETSEPSDQVGSPSEAMAEAATADRDQPQPTEAAFLSERAPVRSGAAKAAYAAGITLLCITLALQLVQMFRAEIGAQWPAARASLVRLCEVMRCTVGWPKRGEMLAVVGSELQALP